MRNVPAPNRDGRARSAANVDGCRIGVAKVKCSRPCGINAYYARSRRLDGDTARCGRKGNLLSPAQALPQIDVVNQGVALQLVGEAEAALVGSGFQVEGQRRSRVAGHATDETCVDGLARIDQGRVPAR